MPGCSAIGCSNRSEKGFLMFPFPSDKDPTRKLKWEVAVNRLDSDGKLWKSSFGSRLCKDHFEDDAFEKMREDGKLKLRRNSLPTWFTHKKCKFPRKRKRRSAEAVAEPSTKIPLNDHCYTKSPRAAAADKCDSHSTKGQLSRLDGDTEHESEDIRVEEVSEHSTSPTSSDRLIRQLQQRNHFLEQQLRRVEAAAALCRLSESGDGC